MDCGAVPDLLFENELFGHSRGAFTDAQTDQKGLVTLAQNGTLFIDEVDSLSAAAQGKVLRLLQENTYRPLGSEHFRSAHIRVIAATNNDLQGLVHHRQFRADFFFRINVLRAHLPALRDRRGDIAPLARHFVETVCQAANMANKTLSPAAIQKLEHYNWPGNVRELCNSIQRAVLNAPGRQIAAAHVELISATQVAANIETYFRKAKVQAIEDFERDYVESMLQRHGGNITRAAREAGKDRRAFGRLAKKYGFQPRAS